MDKNWSPSTAMLPHPVRYVAALVAACLLTACSSGDNGGSPAPSPSASSAAGGNVDPALKVSTPLPTDAVLDDPCSVLSPSQAAQIGLNPTGKLDDRAPKACTWESSGNAENSVGIGALPQNKNGLSDIYAGRSSAAYFTPVTIEGYPAVFTDKTDDRSTGSCQLWIGITGQLAVSVGTVINVGANKSDPCPIAQKAGQAMIDHLKGAA
ncbi:DUF3558 domain-containing protein [Amycolatopsis sp. NPDC001319]|uniref:DUF3558 domain-containing protein n=1 Tax=unclassified Amycolatopsis TaxID=2618356 RepID=UPI0036A05B8C